MKTEELMGEICASFLSSQRLAGITGAEARATEIFGGQKENCSFYEIYVFLNTIFSKYKPINHFEQ